MDKAVNVYNLILSLEPKLRHTWNTRKNPMKRTVTTACSQMALGQPTASPAPSPPPCLSAATRATAWVAAAAAAGGPAAPA